MKLFKVRAEYEIVVLAESAEEAENNVEYIIKNEADDPAEFISSEEINTIDDLPTGWDSKCRPWGKRDPYDRTIEDIINNKFPSPINHE